MPRVKPPLAHAYDVEPEMRRCDNPGCPEEGAHRAPRSPNELETYYWFCVEHARAYNAQWDFFDGMNEKEIESFRIADVTGHRPTWPLGARACDVRKPWEGVRDVFGVIRDGAQGGRFDAEPRLPRDERDALAVLNLSQTAALDEIKSRFKELAKRYHPDLNGGDQSAEERLKPVIEAYRLLAKRRAD